MYDTVTRGGTLIDGAGTPILEDEKETGARPGRLVRAGR
jgi:N-acyl-D-aspartate/D-glutamate deacylase